MAPTRAKKGKKAKNNPTTAEDSNTHENISIPKGPLYPPPVSSYSVPGSPVTKISPSIQPSPVLSAANGTSNEDFRTNSFPPLNLAENFDLGPFPDIDWSLFSDKPKRTKGKTKLRRPKDQSTSGDEKETQVEEQAYAPDRPIRTTMSNTPQAEDQGVSPESRVEHLQQSALEQDSPRTPRNGQVHPHIPDSNQYPPSGFHTQQPYYPRGRPWYSPHMSYMPYGYGPSPRDGRDGSPFRNPYGHFPPYPSYPRESNHQRHDSMGSRGSPPDMPLRSPSQVGGDNATAVEEDPELLSRLHLAVPDLEQLLRRYKETHSELGLREALVRKKEAESAEMIKHKEEHINRLMTQFHDTESKHTKEHNRLRFHVGRLEDSVKELEEQLDASESLRRQADAAIKELSEQKMVLMRERMVIAQAAAHERDEMIKDFEDWKNNANSLLEAERNHVAELTSQEEELKEKASTAQGSLDEALSREKELQQQLDIERETNAKGFEVQKAALEKEWEEKQQALVNSHNEEIEALKNEHETTEKETAEQIEALKNGHGEVMESLRDGHGEEMDALKNGHDEEMEALKAKHEEEIGALKQAHEEEIEALKKAHKEDLNEQTRGFVSLQESLNLKMTAENQNLQEEMEALKKAWDDDKTRFEGIISEMKEVAASIDEEKGRLTKLVEAYGDFTDVKSKGDLHYMQAFEKLSEQIFNLSSTYFKTPTLPLPGDVVAKIPAFLPSIIENTQSSLQLRAAYVAHLIATILFTRVFTPFLFGLERRSEAVEEVLSQLSDQMRSKSNRKEASWRQHTLLAAYTTTDAKKRTNKEAGSVVDDIVDTIIPFADSGAEEVLRSSVKAIVKLAVETWRFARLEREKIAAVMPAVDEEVDADDEGFWQQYSMDSSSIPLTAESSPSDSSGKVLLRLFPIIRREPVHEDFKSTDNEFKDKGFIYSRGLALYSDSPVF